MKFKKELKYFDNFRIDLIEMLPDAVLKGRFLEIGCGTGGTLEYLKSQGAQYVAGVEINREVVELASAKGLDFTVIANIEKDELPFNKNEFDCVIFGDVLEHLYDPWNALKKITFFLKNDGYILLSIPNIKHYPILWNLILHDNWSYSKTGLLDNTHIRFFTLKEIKKLLAFSNLEMVELRYNTDSRRMFWILNTLFFNSLFSFSVVQYRVMARKVK